MVHPSAHFLHINMATAFEFNWVGSLQLHPSRTWQAGQLYKGNEPHRIVIALINEDLKWFPWRMGP